MTLSGREFYIIVVKILKALMKKIRLYAKRWQLKKSIRNQNTNINEECLWLGFIRVHVAKKRIRACRQTNRNFQNWNAKGKKMKQYQELWYKRCNVLHNVNIK